MLVPRPKGILSDSRKGFWTWHEEKHQTTPMHELEFGCYVLMSVESQLQSPTCQFLILYFRLHSKSSCCSIYIIFNFEHFVKMKISFLSSWLTASISTAESSLTSDLNQGVKPRSIHSGSTCVSSSYSVRRAMLKPFC